MIENNLLIVLTALALDRLFGEPRRLHPLVGFGALARSLESRLYGKHNMSAHPRQLRGLFAVTLCVAPLCVLVSTIPLPGLLTPAVEIIFLYLTIGWKSLEQHARQVSDALRDNDLANARIRVGMIVSRDTDKLNAPEISKATVESVLENGNDAVFAAIFWFLLAGVPGVLAYRLVNTLDAMWGYRNERYLYFGWAAARLDDVLNFIPARLTALSYALTGQCFQGLFCWRTQGRYWKSPNAGVVMAAGAGSLALLIGGPARYDGKLQLRPILGQGNEPIRDDIGATLKLIQHSLMLWSLCLFGGIIVIYYLPAS